MSNVQTNPVAKWILIGVCVISLCAVGAFVLLMIYSTEEHRAAKELRARGFTVEYDWQTDGTFLKRPTGVGNNGLNITPDDCRLICRLPRLVNLAFDEGDMSGLTLDEIGNCPELMYFWCGNVTQFPVDEVRKLAACPIVYIHLLSVDLEDSDLANFTGMTELAGIFLDGNAGITDAGFEHFEKIASLRGLSLTKTSVTKEGVEEFQKKRPDVKVRY